MLFGVITSSFAQQGQSRQYADWQLPLLITTDDIQLVPEHDSSGNVAGFHLYVRKKPQIESVLLCETTKDPYGKSNNYAYRALEYNPINGDELRLLDGKPLVSEGAKYSLIDSTPENHPVFGEAFHIYIPKTLQYGYSWTRNDIITLESGTFINIRTFQKKYADYTGNFVDNPFLFDVRQYYKEITEVVEIEPEPEPEPEAVVPPPSQNEQKPPEPVLINEPVSLLRNGYNIEADDAFKKIANPLLYSSGPQTLIADIKTALEDLKPEDKAEVIFAIDATGSMRNDISLLKKQLIPQLKKRFDGAEVRWGLVFYRDYGGDFNYKDLPVRVYPFTSDWNEVQQNLNRIIIYGGEGGDIPEAVYEALYASIAFFDWHEETEYKKKIILIGDAQPHPVPRESGLYSKELVEQLSKEKNIQIEAILLPEK